MADESTSQGIIQYIRLALDPASSKKVVDDAAQTAQAAGNKLVQALSSQGKTLDAFHAKLLQLRKDFEEAANRNRVQLGTTATLGEVRAQAKKLGETYNTTLSAELKGLPAKFQDAIKFALQASTAEMSGSSRARALADQLATQLSARGAPAAKAAVKEIITVVKQEIKAEAPSLEQAAAQLAEAVDKGVKKKKGGKKLTSLQELKQEIVAETPAAEKVAEQAGKQVGQALDKGVKEEAKAVKATIKGFTAEEEAALQVAVQKAVKNVRAGGHLDTVLSAQSAALSGKVRGFDLFATDKSSPRTAEVRAKFAALVNEALAAGQQADAKLAEGLKKAEPVVQAAAKEVGQKAAMAEKGAFMVDQGAFVQQMLQQAKQTAVLALRKKDPARYDEELTRGYQSAQRSVQAFGSGLTPQQQQNLLKVYRNELEALLNKAASEVKAPAAAEKVGQKVVEAVGTGAKKGQTKAKKDLGESVKEVVQNVGASIDVPRVANEVQERILSLRRTLDERLKNVATRYTSGQVGQSAAAAQALLLAKEFNDNVGATISTYGSRLPQQIRQDLFNNGKADGATLATAATAGAVVGKRYVEGVTKQVTAEKAPLQKAMVYTVKEAFTPTAAAMEEMVTRAFNRARGDWVKFRAELGKELKAAGQQATPEAEQAGDKIGSSIFNRVKEWLGRIGQSAPAPLTAFDKLRSPLQEPGRAYIPFPTTGSQQLGPATPPGLRVSQVMAQATLLTRNAAQALKEFGTEWFTLVKIPKLAPLDWAKDRQLFKQAKGDLTEYRKLVKEAQYETQLSGASFTKLGGFLKGIGVSDVNSYSAGIKGVVANLKGLAAAGGGALPPINSLRGGFMSLLGPIRNVASAFGIYLGLYQVLNFFKSAVSSANEAEAAWARLSQAVSDAGIRLSQVQGPIDQAVAAGRKLGFNQKETVDILGTLVGLTGDYQKSMKSLPVVFDLVRFAHMNAFQASKLTARAIEGETSALSRQGIVLDKNRDLITQFNEKFGREAQAYAGTFPGQVARTSAAFFDLKAAIGDALKAGFVGGGFGGLVEMLEQAVVWVKQNVALFETLAQVLVSIVAGVFEVGRAFRDVFFTIPSLIITPLVGAVMLMPNAFETAWAYIELGAVKFAKVIAGVWDKLFHTDLAHSLDVMEKDIDQRIDRLGKRSADVSNATRAREGELLGNLMGNTPTTFTSTTPHAPDMPLGTGGPVNPQAHRELMARIASLRAQMLRGTEMDAAAKAAEELDKVLSDLKQKKEDLSQTDEDQVKNAKGILEVEKDIATVEGIQESYKKRLAKLESDRAEIAKINHEIQLLTNVAVHGEGKVREEALAKLDALHAKLEEKQKGQTIWSDKFFETQKQIQDIEEVRTKIADKEQAALDKQLRTLRFIAMNDQDPAKRAAAVADMNTQYAEILEKQKGVVKYSNEWFKYQGQLDEITQAIAEGEDKQNKLLDDRVKRLSALVDMDQNREEAVRQLRALGVQQQALLDDELKKLAAGHQTDLEREQTLKRIEILRARINAIETGENTALGKIDEQIAMYEKLMKDPKTYDEGYKGLLATKTKLLNMEQKQNVTAKEREQIDEKIKKVNEDIADSQEGHLKHIREQIDLANKLFKEPQAKTTDSTANRTQTVQGPVGRIRQTISSITRRTTVSGGHGAEDDRAKAEQLYKDAIKEATDELDKQNISADRKLKLLQAITEAQQKLHELEEPSLNLGKRLIDVWSHDWSRIVEASASHTADVMEGFFEKEGFSIKTLRQSLLDVPKGLAKGLANELKQVATQEAARDLAWAIRETALGIGSLAGFNPAAAAGHFASAAEHVAAATAWAALGGVAGRASGTAATPGTTGNFGTNVDNAQKPVSLYIKGGLLDTSDTQQMDALAAAIHAVSGRDVVVQRG